MTNLAENATWEAGIYQIENTDPVSGGAPNQAAGQGINNVAAQQLANRTGYLKTALEALQNSADPYAFYLNTTRGDQRYYTQAQVDQNISDAIANIDLSNIDAATLGGNAPAFYRDAGNLNAGKVPPARLSFATQSEAEAGTATDVVMSPFLTKAAFDQYVTNGGMISQTGGDARYLRRDQGGVVDGDLQANGELVAVKPNNAFLKLIASGNEGAIFYNAAAQVFRVKDGSGVSELLIHAGNIGDYIGITDGGVGDLVWAAYDGHELAYGDLIAGADLRPAGFTSSSVIADNSSASANSTSASVSSGSFNGTWICLGAAITNLGIDRTRYTLFRRKS